MEHDFSISSTRPAQARLALLFLAAAAALPVAVMAAPDAADGAVQLDDYVISATRSVQDASTLPSAVTRLSLEDLATAQIGDLASALSQEPGVIVVNTGAVGAQGTVYLRGASSHQTLFVVDGVRMNDRTASYQNFLGGADLGGLDRVEVLRGPQGTLYGSSAMGGVIAVETRRGRDALTGTISAGLGSFDTWEASAAISGVADSLGYSASVTRYETDNDRPLNSYASWNYSGRLDFAASEDVTIGLTLRGQVGDYEEPGSTTWPSYGQVELKNHLVTTYGEWRGDGLTSRITLGQHRREYAYITQWDASEQDSRREIADWTTTWTLSPAAEIVGGLNYERSRYDVAGSVTRDELLAGFVSGTWRASDVLTLTAGVRHDDFDSVGGATTWRTGVSYKIAAATRVRATYGTGFSAPGSSDVYGVPSWGQVANTDLLPEKSRGWDVGIEQGFGVADLKVGATWFENHFKNLFDWETIDWTTYEGRTINRARAKTRGVELAVSARPVRNIRTRLAYTWLEARDRDTSERLARRPRHTVDAAVVWQATESFTAGLGAHGVADRVDTYGGFAEDYVTVRAFAALKVRRDITLRVRLENALDSKYEDVPGYPARPFGAFASAAWTF